MTGINDLPIELCKLILRSNLSINDLFNCRLVNKKFKNSSFECVHKLVIDRLNEYSNDYWFHNNELINDDQVISFECFRKIRSLSIFNLDKYLKYLKINFNKHQYVEFEEQFNEQFSNLGNLINLKCLEINCMDNYDDYFDYNFKLDLNLKNLKYFKLNIHHLNSACKLNTPKLEKIQFLNRSQILIKSNPESIRHLILWDYEDRLKQFKNLEIIEFTYPYELNENLLSFFVNLKQLKIEKIGMLSEKLSNSLIEILKKSENLKKDIDIYLNGVKIINKDKLNEYQLYKGNVLKFQLDNYDLFDLNLSKIIDLDYSTLNDYYDNLRTDLPSSFFDKFQNISEINVTYQFDKKLNFDNLIWFLNNLKCLKSLIASNESFNQYISNNLPNTIRFLKITKCPSGILFSYVNFDFILKLTELIEFQVQILNRNWNNDLFDLALRSFLDLKYLKVFEFLFKDKKITIEKNKSIFNFKINHINHYVKLNYDQLVSKCNQFRSN